MDKKITDFLGSHRVCSLTTLISDGSPHAAAMHFSHRDVPFELYIQTERNSRKFQALLTKETTKASVVIGFSEEEWTTLQLDGIVIEVKDKNELERVHEMHYLKHPDAKQYRDLPETVFLKFTPIWWRYTEYKPEMKIISSES